MKATKLTRGQLYMAELNRKSICGATTRRIAENRRFLAQHEPTYLKPGVYTQTISGHPYAIDNAVNSFHARMNRDYNGYTILDTTSYPRPDGVCIYVTYQIGTPRNMPVQTAPPRW